MQHEYRCKKEIGMFEPEQNEQQMVHGKSKSCWSGKMSCQEMENLDHGEVLRSLETNMEIQRLKEDQRWWRRREKKGRTKKTH